MKYVLIDPNKKWYKANLHCHTNNSDGFFTPSEIKKHYMDHGYSIVAYSEHELIFDVSELTDNNFVAITSFELSINERDKYASSCYKKDVPPSWREFKTIHLNMFAKDPHNFAHPGTDLSVFREDQRKKYNKEIICDGYHREYTPNSIQEVINRANKQGFLVQFNHPNWSLNDRNDYINLKGLWSLEVLNYSSEIETGADACINVYDDMLRNGHRLFATMGDDNHNHGGSFNGSFGGFNYIGANKLTYEEVIKAMERGDIYCSTGPIIKSLYYDNVANEVTIECSDASIINLIGCFRYFYHVCGENLKKHTFKLTGNEIYFRIVVRDKNNKVAYTHAYFLSDYINK